MDQLSQEQYLQNRDRAEHEANQALLHGLEEAHALREKAGHERTGAILNGVLTGLSGAAQMGAASRMTVPSPQTSPDMLPSVQAHNAKMSALGQAAGSLTGVGKATQDTYGAAASVSEARAREHSARAQAASRRADAAQGEAQEAQRSREKARDLCRQLMELDHASRTAVLRG
ncbi:MAG: hypothetical protein RMJ98_13785 [Myxococcales bacterium]|nr:hypothetical protein [Polyangiaceae bacterium]MDW8250362.1 hypothetical protein [Myxococcales bacterium]